MAMISSSRLAESQHAPPAWKFCAVQSQERFDRENAQRADRAKMNGRRAFLIAGSGKPRRGHEKHCPAARIEAAKKTSARGRNQAGTTRKDREEVEVLRGSLHGVAQAASATPGGCAPAWLRRWGPRPALGLANKWVFEFVSLSQKVTNAPINPNLDSSSKTDLETRGKNRAFRARADAAQSARQGGTEPGTTRFRDGRKTTIGHQPRGGAPARARLSRGQEGPT